MGVACVDVLPVWLESSLMVVGERPDLSTLFTGVASAGQTIKLPGTRAALSKVLPSRERSRCEFTSGGIRGVVGSCFSGSYEALTIQVIVC